MSAKGKRAAGKPASPWIAPVVVAVVTCAAFLPVLSNQFVEWDDYENITSNPYYRGLGWSQLRWMFTTFHMGPYQPLSWLTLGLDYAVWGMNPAGYHLTSLILHAANGFLFYFVSYRLIASAFPNVGERSWQLTISATFAALMFAIHPLRVESVAWATERRDVVSGLFFLTAIYCYLKANSNPPDDSRGRWLAAAVFTYILSLLGKATAMTLPVLLLILDIYPLRRLDGRPRNWRTPGQPRVLYEKIPFVVPAVSFAVVALIGQQQVAAIKSLETYSIGSRIAQALYGTSFYFWKTFLPIRLSPLYEIPPHFSPWDLVIVAGAIATIALTVIFYLARNRWPAGWICWMFAVVALAPVVGILSTGPQLVAERYSYLGCLSWAVLAGGLMLHILQRADARKTATVVTIAVIITIVFSLLTWREAMVWRDTGTLWNHVLNFDQNSSIAHYNLARFLARQGEHTEAIAHYRKALAIRANDADAHNNLGLLLAIRGDTEDSLKEFQTAVRVDPTYAKGFFNLGRIYARQGKLEQAAENYREAMRLKPDEAEIRFGLGNVLARQGRFEAASAQFEQATKLKPEFAEAQMALAGSLSAQGKNEEAQRHYQKALQLLRSQSQATN